MDKIVIQKTTGNPIGKTGGSIWVSKDVNDRLESISDETGIAKQKITDFLLRKALEATAMEKYFSAKEVLSILGICNTTLWKICKDGGLTPYMVGNRRRFSESDIIAYLERGRQSNAKKQDC